MKNHYYLTLLIACLTSVLQGQQLSKSQSESNNDSKLIRSYKNVMPVKESVKTIASNQVTPYSVYHPSPSCNIAYYPFNGNAYDSIGSYNATVNGATLTTDHLGNANKAYLFNGSSDYISSSAPVPTGNAPRSITAWFNTSDTTTNSGYGYNTIVSWGDVNTNKMFSIATAQHGYIRFDGFANDIRTTKFAADGKWHFIAVTHDGDTTKIYLDDTLIAKKGTTYNTDSSAFMIGARINQTNQFMNGKIDDVRLFRCAISPKEIDSLFGKKTSPTPLCDIAYYPFNGNADDSLGSYNATVYGATLTTDHLGNANKAYLFNGSSDYISSSAPVPTGNSPRSVTAWFNTSDTTTNSGYGYNTIVSWGDINTNEMFSIATAQHGDIRFDGFANDIRTTKFAADGKWHFIAVTHDGDTTKIYLDDTLIAQKGTTYKTVSSSLMIGARINQTNQFMNGKIDDVRIYKCAISPKDINSLYTSNTTGISSQNIIHSSVSVYPNPSNGFIFFDLKGITGKYELKIIDMLGREIRNEKGAVQEESIKTISFQNISKGVYSVILQTGESIITKNVIVY